MKKIDEQVKNAVANWKAMRGKDTKVEIVGGYLKVYLHGNLIFWAESPSKWNASNCGWNSLTTRARLNACLAGVGANVWVSSVDGEMCVCRCRHGKVTYIGKDVGKFSQSAENETVGAEVRRVTLKYSPELVRFHVWRKLEYGVEFQCGVYKSEAAANAVAKKIREGVM